MLKYIINDQLINQNDAFVHVSDLGLLRGYGVFDFFRLQGNHPLFFDDHIERFFHSARVLRLEVPLPKATLKAKVLEMIEVNGINNSGVRLVLTGGASENGYSIGHPTLLVLQEPLSTPPKENFEQGVKLISTEYLRDLPEVKTTNYLMGIYKLPEMQLEGAADVLYHWEGIVSEAARSNIFIVTQDNTVVTPGEGMLRGITRKKIIELAKNEFSVELRRVHLDELHNAREVFITGTTKLVTPVVQIDDVTIANGKVGKTTKKLQKLLKAYVQQYVQKR
jgi:branched-subunit amino acid aminotransferase/4-amino-4-deoxychorismate lyase